MKFILRCPKCGGTDIHLFEDKRGIGSAQVDSRILSCRCGKQLFGEQIDAEIEKQEALLKKAPPIKEERPREIEKIHSTARREELLRRREKLRAEKEAKEAANRQWIAEILAKKEAPKPTPKPEVEICAWMDCNEPARPNSKYCSRSCSNSNARWRHERRRRGLSPSLQSAPTGRPGSPSA